MALRVKMRCPVHGVELISTKKIPFNLHGDTIQEPIFYCEKCVQYYIHTNVVPYGSEFDYEGKNVINTPEEIYDLNESHRGVIYVELAKVRSYTPPFIPRICYKDQASLRFVSDAIINIDGISREMEGYYCDKCNDFYMEEDAYDDICYEFGDAAQTDKYEKQRTEIIENNSKITRSYNIAQIRPSVTRYTTNEVDDKILSYEDCERNYDIKYPFSLLHYAFIFRRFDAVLNIIKGFDHDEWKEALHFAGPEGYEWITPLVCAKWNLNYIWAYDDRNNTKLVQRLEEFLNDVDHIDEVMEYTDSIDKDNNDIFSVFWNGNQPLLDIVYYEKQRMASAQVSKNDFSIVMDEVGTGKTVSAIYAIREIIQKKTDSNQKARILVICPYNKREDWQNDIRRQLGRYAHVVAQGDNGAMYRGDLKKIFFKENEHIIMISGQRQGSDKEGSYSALKGSIESYSRSEAWDMTIIDEAHLSFNNYFGISASKAMLMTATPIVVNARGERTFDDYLKLVCKILNKKVDAVIDPISKAVPDVEDMYVNWFREDMGQASAERKIRFVLCKRWAEREDIFYQIRDEKGMLAALQYDQDDDYLYWAATDKYGLRNIQKPRKNAKLERLVSLLCENNKSFIIFCEHQFVADAIFDTLKDRFSDSVVAEKYGQYENQCGLDNVQDGQLVNTLIQALRNKERVLFVTTGKTGGTGLNLGEFDGVIHYELPFTSIELEQRFGRVDRINIIMSGNTKDMIFLLNECQDDENDMEINRMLYYCTTKIDVACQFMPVRNTILYYPEFIKRNRKAIRESLQALQKEYILSEANENRIKDFHRKIRKLENDIKKDPAWIYIEPLDKNIRCSALMALSNARDDRIPEQYYKLLQEYLEYWKTTRLERSAYQKMYKVFQEARKNAYHWLAIIGLVKVEKDSEIFIGQEQNDDGEEEKINYDLESADKQSEKSKGTVQQQISEIIALMDRCVFDNERLKSFSSDGIFCYQNGMIKRTSVENYRNGKGWC